jgi:hypothetical protein
MFIHCTPKYTILSVVGILECENYGSFDFLIAMALFKITFLNFGNS